MKNASRIFLILTVMVMASFNGPAGAADPDAGQQQVSVKKAEAEASVPVKDAPLSESMLKTRRNPMAVTRDPFLPLPKPKKAQEVQNLEKQQEEDPLMGIRYQGLVKMGETFFVLLHTQDGKGVYQVNDQVNGLTITVIDEGSVTFVKDNETFKLQRGDL